MIRLAILSDVQALASVHIASWQTAYRGILPDEVLNNLSSELFEVNWRKHILNAQRTNLILEVDGLLVGFISLGSSRDDAGLEIGEIYAFYLHPNSWGEGYGRMLLNQALNSLKTQFSVVTLWVLEDNSRARGFYERMGFRNDEKSKNIRLYEVELPEIRYCMKFL